MGLHSATAHRLARRAPAALEPCAQLVVEVRFTLLHARLLGLIQHRRGGAGQAWLARRR